MLNFATTNEGKLEEARSHLAGVTDVEQFDYDYLEIQSDDLAAIAARGARESFDALEGEAPVIVDDTGLFIREFDGFPGPYAAYVEHTLGVERVWDLASDLEDRRAAFRCIVAYADEDGVETFEGRVQGTLVAPRGEGGFGYDPIFEFDGTTFAEMRTEEKNAFSHRARALSKLADWLVDE
ncbi:Inosine/xanthosine triphosphate pyrophosphatase,all-alpha NTP-PPase family [Halanaeroarchaeum sp. HSR-CO]|uniref:RdgB/HAM1 family non-canonical purine NTP pyrophosphatase n=1 Tax=Halanaeroarchaeum sp. HSR-CO TaxID=2866382 RepID=UPI00217DA429|nr:RdgB/HAM1 family non-canonical purine NTP pyrophosphatase [Halanaeroarchaeum sp. HSR-CO]UWG48885.1 Inosine/xanthosine triphosphate pyrophosphatase,all-alpha NTP-PPase family [Halanaeroarchaeum sp. HSR-CO]